MQNINQILTAAKAAVSHSGLVQTDIDKRRRKEAGELFDAMRLSRDLTVQCLDHEDWSVQKAALGMFIDHWRGDEIVEEICERLALSPQIDVCLRAISALAFVRNHVYQKKVSSTLGEYALNTQLAENIRREVYATLRVTFGTPAIKASALRDWQTSGEIDANVIAQCISADSISDKMVNHLDENKIRATEFYLEGKRLLAIGSYEAAIEKFSHALAEWPMGCGSFVMRGKAHEAIGNLVDAVNDFSSVIRLLPHLPHLYRYRGEIHKRLGHIDLSIADFEQAKRLESGTE
jgi:tetratricopeptide (TPR) repeat protein